MTTASPPPLNLSEPQYVSTDILLKALVVGFSTVFNGDAVHNIITEVIQKTGIRCSQESIAAAVALLPVARKGKGKKKIADPSKPKKRRNINVYQVYITKAFDYLKSHPRESNGKPGGPMVAASTSWAHMPAEIKKEFEDKYKPLVEKLNQRQSNDALPSVDLLHTIEEYERNTLKEPAFFKKLASQSLGAPKAGATPVKQERTEVEGVVGALHSAGKPEKKKKKKKKVNEGGSEVEEAEEKKAKRKRKDEEQTKEKKKKKKKEPSSPSD